MKISFKDFINQNMLCEMASIGTNGKMFFSVDTPYTAYIGNPYFKIYNTQKYQSDSKVVSLSFLRPEFIYHKRDVRPWNDINKSDMKEILKFLNEKSKKSKLHTNWEYAIIIYNSEHYDLSEKETESITEFKSEKDPLPINLPIPDYLSLF